MIGKVFRLNIGMPRRMLSTLACTTIYAGGNRTEAISSSYPCWSLMRQQSRSEWLNGSPLSTYKPIFMETLCFATRSKANLDNSIQWYSYESTCCHHQWKDSSTVKNIVPDVANPSRCDQGDTMGRSVSAWQLFWRPAVKVNLLINARQEYVLVIYWHAAKGWNQDQGQSNLLTLSLQPYRYQYCVQLISTIILQSRPHLFSTVKTLSWHGFAGTKTRWQRVKVLCKLASHMRETRMAIAKGYKALLKPSWSLWLDTRIRLSVSQRW